MAAQQVVESPVNTRAPLEVLPTITPELPTFTAVPSVQGTINYGANCRTGPGANFPNVLVYEQGTLVNVVGTNKATDKSTWWLVSSSDQTDCWLIDAAVAIIGDKSSVVLVVSLPTPTPVPPPSWAGTWKHWFGGGFDGAADDTGTITFIQTGNYLTASFIMWGMTFNVSGTLSEDGLQFNGYMTRIPKGWGWDVVLKRNPTNLNQFHGSWIVPGQPSQDGTWCGAINGASKPNPCK